MSIHRRSSACIGGFLLLLSSGLCPLASGLSVTNAPATNITATFAVLRADLVETNGCASNLTVIVYYGDNNGGTNPAAWDYALTNAATPIGVLSLPVTNLVQATMYWFKARASESGGTNDWADTSAYFWTATAAATSALPAVTFAVSADSNGVVVSPTNLWEANAIARTGDTAAVRAQIGSLSNQLAAVDTNLQAQINTLTNVANISTGNVACVGTRAVVTNDPGNEALYLVDGAGRVILQISSGGGIRLGHRTGSDGYGVSLGDSATSGVAGVSLGVGAFGSGSGIAVGQNAETWADNCLQLGAGSNGVAGTLRVFGNLLLDADGYIPNARFGAGGPAISFAVTNYGPTTNVLYYGNGVVTNKVQL